MPPKSAVGRREGGSMTDDPKGDAAETREWLDALELGRGLRGSGARRRAARRGRDLGPPQGRQAAVRGQHRLCQHHPPRGSARTSRRPQARTNHPPLCPVERGGDRPARQQGILRARRPYRQLPVGGDALRHRLHALLARSRRDAGRRSRLFPGPLLAGHLCARLPRGAPRPRISSSTSVRKSAARGFRPIRTPG